jgi:ribosomal protein L40E
MTKNEHLIYDFKSADEPVLVEHKAYSGNSLKPYFYFATKKRIFRCHGKKVQDAYYFQVYSIEPRKEREWNYFKFSIPLFLISSIISIVLPNIITPFLVILSILLFFSPIFLTNKYYELGIAGRSWPWKIYGRGSSTCEKFIDKIREVKKTEGSEKITILKPIVCPNCGARNADDAIYCYSCGEKLIKG